MMTILQAIEEHTSWVSEIETDILEIIKQKVQKQLARFNQ